MGPVGPEMLAEVETIVEVDGDKPTFIGKTKTICTSAVMKMNIKKQMFLVGDIFMRKFYTIFDRDNNKVGLARARSGQDFSAVSEQSKLNSEMLATKGAKK